MIQHVDKYPIDEIFKKDADFYYVIPKYQREYTWGYSEWQALYDDISENSIGYFIGSIICINTADAISPRLEVIDGQQRLTTLCLLLAAIYNKLKEYKEQLDEDQLDDLTSLRKSIICKKEQTKGLILIPQIQNYNQEDFAAVMADNGIIKVGQKKPFFPLRKISRCYNYYLGRLQQDINEAIGRDEDPIECILEIKKKICRSMLVKIEVSTHSDAYILFESLNNRGTPLTAIDLMKNLIMARAEKVGLTVDDCFEQWKILLDDLSDDYATQERFFRHYYNAFKSKLNEPFKADDPKKKDPLGYVATKSNLLQIFEKLINRNLAGFLDDILECGDIYSKFIDPDDAEIEIRPSLKNLSRIQGAPAYLLLLYLFKKRAELKLDTKNLVKIIDILTVFFVRRNITDYPNTRDLTRIFMDIIQSIESGNAESDAVYQLIMKELVGISSSDEKFKEMLEGDIYKENSGAARYVLCALAERSMTEETWTDLWLQKEYGKGSKKYYVWTIEHIFPEGENVPQVWVDMIAGGDKALANDYLQTYVHKLGNLTVTGYNSNLSNLAFEQKRDRKNKEDKYIGYKNGLAINKELAAKDSWTIEDIKNRTQKMSQVLLDLFKFPEA